MARAARAHRRAAPAAAVPASADTEPQAVPAAESGEVLPQQPESRRNKRMTPQDYARTRSIKDKKNAQPTTPGSPSENPESLMESGEFGLNVFDERQRALVEERTESMEIRRKAGIAWLRERKLRKEAVLSGIVYICFMSLYFYVILDQARVWDAHKLEFSLREYLTNKGSPNNGDELGDAVTFEEIADDGNIWYWLEHGLLDVLFPEQQWYNGEAWVENESNYIMHYNRLIGGFKLVQRRVEENWPGCLRSARFQDFYSMCWPAYSDQSKDTRAYGPSHDPDKFTWENDAFGGGYPVELTLDRKLAYETIAELKKDRWTDKNTRQLSIEFTIYNGNMHLFTLVNAEINIIPTGLTTTSYNMETFRVELYRTTHDWIRFTCELIFLLFVCSTLFFEMVELFRPPIEFGVRLAFVTHIRRYFSDFWNYMDIVRIIMFAVVIEKYVEILAHNQASSLQLPLPEGQKFPELDNLAVAWRAYKRLNGLNVVLCLLTIFKFMNKSPRYGVLVRTIGRAAPDLVKFAIMFVLCMASFSIMGILMFGSALEEWSTPWNAIQVLFMMITGEYGYEPVMKVDPMGAPIFYFLYLIIVFFLLVNILLAIMMDAYATLREDLAREQVELLQKYDFPIVNELILQGMSTAARFVPLWDRPIFLRTEDILERLEENEQLQEECWFDIPPATVNNPDPAPEEIIGWSLLSQIYPVDEARFMMILVGVPVDDKVDYVQPGQDHKKREKKSFRTAAAALAAMASPRASLDSPPPHSMATDDALPTETSAVILEAPPRHAPPASRRVAPGPPPPPPPPPPPDNHHMLLYDLPPSDGPDGAADIDALAGGKRRESDSKTDSHEAVLASASAGAAAAAAALMSAAAAAGKRASLDEQVVEEEEEEEEGGDAEQEEGAADAAGGSGHLVSDPKDSAKGSSGGGDEGAGSSSYHSGASSVRGSSEISARTADGHGHGSEAASFVHELVYGGRGGEGGMGGGDGAAAAGMIAAAAQQGPEMHGFRLAPDDEDSAVEMRLRRMEATLMALGEKMSAVMDAVERNGPGSEI